MAGRHAVYSLAASAIIAVAMFAGAQTHAYAADSEARISSAEMAKVGLEVVQARIAAGDPTGAIYAASFASEQFASDLERLKASDPGPTAEMHVALLDLPPAIRSQSQDIAESVADALLMLESLDVPAADYRLAVSELLSVADEQYAAHDKDGVDAAYDISRLLFERADAIFRANADPNIMLDREQISFFDDIDEAITENAGFVRVGTLVSAIQRDLAGTETVVRDQARLYANIRDLYSQMLELVDAGEYEAAEEIAIEAYLENFEYLEPALEIVDAEFMYALEIDMREELRIMLKRELPPAEIREFVEESILIDLEKGEIMTATYLQDNAGVVAQPQERETAERGSATGEQQAAVRDEIDFIRESLREMQVHYDKGDYESAYASARTAYLDSYEHVEIPLRPIDPDFTLEVEYQFAELRNLIKERASSEDVREAAIAIERSLDESERLVTGTGQIAPFIAFSASFAIIFREGLEAVLILGAIVTYLEASRNNRFKKYVHYGVIGAIGATAVTWLVASYIVEISGASRELIEAIAALSATAVLFYVSFWILNKIEHKKWMEFVKAKVWQATTTGSVMVFVMLSFFTVYREGFETVLFYQAMFGFAKYMEAYVGAGFVVGMGSLLLLYFVMRKLGKRLPLRVLFGLTMGVGAYLSIAFLGNAVRELQVLDIVPYTGMLGTIPRLDINMATMTGIYPTLETLVAQVTLLAVYMVASVYVLILRPKRERAMAQMRKSRGG